MYFFSNSPVKCRLTKVVCGAHIPISILSPPKPIPRSRAPYLWSSCYPASVAAHFKSPCVTYLTGTTITAQDELERGNVLFLFL